MSRAIPLLSSRPLVACYRVTFTFIMPLLGIICNVFYQVDSERETSSVSYFFFVYLCPLSNNGRIKNRNMS
jgi:hypothetical protein